MEDFKTNNFNNPQYWIIRILLVLAFGISYYYIVNQFINITPIHLIIIAVFGILIITTRQVDEIKITTTELSIYQCSIIPFLRSKRVYKTDSIKSFKQNSRYMTGGGLSNWSDKLLSTTSALEILFENGNTEIINGRIHKEGLKGLIKEFKKIKKTAPNKA